MQVKLIKDQYYETEPRLPTRGTAGAAGYDLYTPNEVVLHPGNVTPVNTGVCIAIPPGHVGLMKDRSSRGARGIHVFGGVIDEDYRGELIVLLYNATNAAYPIMRTERIAQLVIVQYYGGAVEEVAELPPSVRGEGGFGSTGK